MKNFEQKSTMLGLAFSSTRIKAVLEGPDGTMLVTGAHDRENRFESGSWGMALLAGDRLHYQESETLESYLRNRLFCRRRR